MAKKMAKRAVSLLCAVVMLVSMLVVPARATYNPALDKMYLGTKFYINHYYTSFAESKCILHSALAGTGDRALDLSNNDSRYDGQNIQMWDTNYSWAQDFTIKPDPNSPNSGWYVIQHTQSSKVLDIENSQENVILWTYHGGDNQLWKFIGVYERLNSGYGNFLGYLIQSKTGKYLTVKSGKVDTDKNAIGRGSNVIATDFLESKYQIWWMESTPKAYFTYVSDIMQDSNDSSAGFINFEFFIGTGYYQIDSYGGTGFLNTNFQDMEWNQAGSICRGRLRIEAYARGEGNITLTLTCDNGCSLGNDATVSRYAAVT